MRKFLIIIVSIFSLFSLNAQTLIKEIGKKDIGFFNKNTIKEYSEIEINFESLLLEDVVVDFFGFNNILKHSNTNYNDINMSWFAENKEDNIKLILNISKKNVYGVLTYQNNIYRIETHKNKYYISELDHSQYPNESCDNLNIKSTTNSNGKSIQSSGSYFPDECKLNLLVMYTTAAKDSVSDINNLIQTAIDETNQSFINSNVDYEVQLVHSVETDYIETSNLYLDRDRFRIENDSYMDNVHLLRQQYGADICILIEDVAGYCGVASSILASPQKAFCVVDYDCATGYYSFAHEIGHLIGARHDTYVDPSNTPFNFGHAYVNVSEGWRTIMGYNTACSGSGGCTRLNYWSNPNIDYNSDPMGTVGSANNARVLNLQLPNAMSYTLGTDVLFINQTDVNNQNVLFAGFEYTSGNVNVYSGYNKKFLAEQSLTLKPGFTATSGSDFLARINPCGEEDDLGSDFKKDEFDIANYNHKLINEIGIYPNPIFNNVTILTIKNQDFKSVNIDFFDVNGKKLKTQKKSYSGSKYELNFNDLPISTYYLKIYLDGKLFSNNKILKL